MNTLYRSSLLLVLLTLFAGTSLIAQSKTAPKKLPMTGKAEPGWEPLDKAILEFADTIKAQAATVCVTKEGAVLYSKGFGWSDKGRTKLTAPDAQLRIASLTKPIMTAATKKIIASGNLKLTDKAFEILTLKPAGGIYGDTRFKAITIDHLLNHKGGWDSKKYDDPMFQTKLIAKELKLTKPVTSSNIIEYMLSKTLNFEPGAKEAYSNFGFCVLGRVLEKVEKKPLGDILEQTIFKPLAITDMKLGSSSSAKRAPKEVWYPVPDDAFSLEVLDANGGLIASAPSICKFLQAFWMEGTPRSLNDNTRRYTFFGSLPGTTSMARQRNDGYNICVLLNNRRETTSVEDNDMLQNLVDDAIDAIVKK